MSHSAQYKVNKKAQRLKLKGLNRATGKTVQATKPIMVKYGLEGIGKTYPIPLESVEEKREKLRALIALDTNPKRVIVIPKGAQ